MNKKRIIIILIFLGIVFMLSCIGIILYKEKLKTEQLELEKRIRLNRHIDIEVYEEKTIKEIFISEPIEITYESKIDTNTLGKKKVNIRYRNNKREFKSQVYVNVVDKTPPLIISKSSYTLYKGKSIDFVNYILCGDNYDDKPARKVIGNYDNNKIGTYKVKYYAEDSSGNSSEKDFVIKVINEPKDGSSTGSSEKLEKFSNIIKKYKNSNNQIGIDVSKWQGDIDFNKVKNAGAEFVIIRMGIQNGVGGELSLDKFFRKNISEANKVGLKVGVYLYTYASNENDAITQAKWVLNNLKGYKAELGVAYDWESWNRFNELNLSFYRFTEVANTFLDYVKKEGYNAMLYSSKYYLENVWLVKKHSIWLAHYIDKTDYTGNYIMWQLMNTGSINGINGAVDVDILYK